MKRVAYIGEDIDVAKELAAWLLERAHAHGLRETRGQGGGVKPLAEIIVYAGMDRMELARAIAFACEGVWASSSFAGMAHVAAERHNALLGADFVVALPFESDAGDRGDGPCGYEEYELRLRQDMAFLAPDAEMVCLAPAIPLKAQLAPWF